MLHLPFFAFLLIAPFAGPLTVSPRTRRAAVELPAEPPAEPSTVREAVSRADLDAALRVNWKHQGYRQTLDKLDAEIAGSRLGKAHPMTVRLRQKRDVYVRKMKELEAEVEAGLRQGHGQFAGEGLGLVVAKAPPAAAAQLKLPRGAGLVVHRVIPNTPAAAGDVLPDDVLHRLDGQLLVNTEQFEVVVGALDPGGEVRVELFRDGAPLKRVIKIGDRPE